MSHAVHVSLGVHTSARVHGGLMRAMRVVRMHSQRAVAAGSYRRAMSVHRGSFVGDKRSCASVCCPHVCFGARNHNCETFFCHTKAHFFIARETVTGNGLRSIGSVGT